MEQKYIQIKSMEKQLKSDLALFNVKYVNGIDFTQRSEK